MKKELLFGAAYYLEYMPSDRLEEDVEMMKLAGMNTIRIAESTWSTLQPAEGVWDFSYIDRVMEIAERENINVIIGTPTYAVPSWLVKKDPKVLAVTAAGKGTYGRRQIMDITNETFRSHAKEVIERLVEHTASCRNVIGFQIDNETKYYGLSSEGIQKQFVEHLKRKFKTTEALNKAYYLAYWSNSIADWDDFPDMNGCINGGLAGEYDRFRRTVAAEYLEWQANLVKPYLREDQFITHNFDFQWKKFGADIAQDGYSYGVQPDINHYEASRAVTVAGCDIYHPTKDDLTGAEIAFGGDSIRSLKNDNYLVLETQAQAFKYWTPYKGQLRLHAYSHVASGADCVMYWNWHSIHNGYETYWKGVLSHDLAWNPVYGEACEIGVEWKKIGHRITHLKKKNRVALVTDTHSMTAFNWFPIDKKLSYNDVVRWIYDSLYELNLECDVVDVNALDLSRYDTVITPALYSVTEELTERLKTFVADGGTLISTFRSFVSDDCFSVYPDAQPHGLTDVFGVTWNQFTHPGDAKVWGRRVKRFAELLRTVSENVTVLASYEHPYWGEYAALTENTYGNGRAYYIGCYTKKAVIKRLFRELFKTDGKPEWPLIVRSGVNEEGEQVHFLFNYSKKKEKLRCEYEKATDILTGREYEKGEMIHLKDWGVAVLIEE